MVEILIVIGILVLAMAVTMPTIATILSSGADAQAYNMFAGYLAGGRALAIRNGTYVGVHLQMAHSTTGLSNACFGALVWIDPKQNTGMFTLVEGSEPKRMPGSMAFGKLNATYVSGSDFQNLNQNNLGDFTTMTIVFSPRGEIVTLVNGVNVVFDPNCALFKVPTRVWAYPQPEPGVTAVTLFDYGQLAAQSNNGMTAYLHERGQFLPINVYTGFMAKRR